MPKTYSPEFRRKVLDLLAAGRSVALIVSDLGVSGQTVYNWRRHVWLTDLIRSVHAASRAPRRQSSHAELTLGQGIAVGHNA